MQPLRTMLNHVRFEQYHVFRAESRVLTAQSGAAEGEGAQENTASPAPASDPTESTAAIPQTATEAQKPDSSAKSESAAHPAEAPVAKKGPEAESKPPASLEAATSEISVTGNAEVPDVPAQSQPEGAPSGFRLRTTTRLVDVGLVAYDKNGRPVTDLKQCDFEIYDNGRKQETKYFGQAGVAAPAALPSPVLAQPSGEPAQAVYSNRQIAPTLQSGTAAPESHTTIFLIDSSHVVFADLAYARGEMLRFLKTVPSDEPVGLYVLRRYGFEILREPTTDHNELAAALHNWMPSAQDLLQSQQEEMRNRQQMEYVRSSKDLLAMNGNTPTGSGDIDSAPDIQRRSLGDHPEQEALGYLVPVARHVAAFKGHKSLIWVASDNVLADFSEKTPQVEKGDKYLDLLALRATEALKVRSASILSIAPS